MTENYNGRDPEIPPGNSLQAFHHGFDHRAPFQGKKLLEPPHTPRLPGGQNDRRNQHYSTLTCCGK